MADDARVEALFHAALALRAHERAAFLAREEPDIAIRNEVLSLLSFDTDRTSEALRGFERAPLGERIGDVIGPYTLVTLLGEGGFGSVYLAHQEEPVRRDVALKIVKVGMDTRLVVARFEAERRAIAAMDHPNIARVFDAGSTDTGRPYFAMEHVPGDPVTAYCDTRRLTLDARLAIFLQVCRAVEHAHQKAILHRDLKPSNILVRDIDGRPFVKVIDFGIAKALDAEPDGAGTHGSATIEGVPIGTPAYMSPEQARGDWARVDTRSDIYALGVLLFELLTGRLPFESLRQARSPEHVRSAHRAGPPRPSTRAGETTVEAARARGADPPTLARRIRGDLDWIVLKAIAHEPSDRYPAVAELASDVDRFLRSEPVTATPPSTMYRIRKFVLRHRVGVAVVAAGLALLLAGIAGTTAGLVRAVDAERRAVGLAADESAARALAEQRFEQVRSIGRTLIFDIRDAVHQVAGATEAHRLIVDTGLTYLDALAVDAQDDPELLREIALGYERLGKVLGEPSAQNLGNQQGALRCLERAAEILASLPDATTSSRTLLERASIARGLGSIQASLGEAGASIASMEEGMRLTELAASVDPSADLAEQIAIGRANMGRLQEQSGAYTDAKASYEAYVAYARSRLATNPDDLTLRSNLIVMQGRITVLCVRWLDEPEEGLALAMESRDAARLLVERAPTNSRYQGLVFESTLNVGESLRKLGRPAEAMREFLAARDAADRAVEADTADLSPKRDRARVLFYLGDTAVSMGDHAASLEHYQEYESLTRALIDATPDYVVLHRDLGIAITGVAVALAELGRFAEAEGRIAEAISLYDRLSAASPGDAPLHQDRLFSRLSRADMLAAWAEAPETPDADRPWRRALDAYTEALGVAEELDAAGLISPAIRPRLQHSQERAARCRAALTAS